MTQLFSDGLEANNLAKWASTAVLQGATPTVVPFPFKGSYSAHFLTNPTLAQAQSQVHAALASINNVYVRAYIYIKQGLTSLQSNDRHYAILIKAGGWNIALVGIRRDITAAPKWVLWYLTKLDTTVTPNVYTGTHKFGTTVLTSANEGRWICVELHYNAATGLYEVFIDGVLEIIMTVPIGFLPPVNGFNIGIEKSGAIGATYDPTGLYTAEVYADEIVVADAYIGLAPAPVLPKLTVASNPELNVNVYVDDKLVGKTPLMLQLATGIHTVRTEQVVTPV